MTVTETSRVAVDAAGLIVVDVECRDCRYNLRGLPPDGACPECGCAIGVSTGDDALCFASPPWLRRIAIGLRITVGGLLFALIARLGLPIAPGPMMLLVAVPAGLFLNGVFRFTSADSRDTNPTTRRWIRWLAIVVTAWYTLEAVVEGTSLAAWLRQRGFATFDTAHMIGSISVAVVDGLLMTCVLAYASMLARRVPDDSLASICKALAGVTSMLFVTPCAIAVCMILSGGPQAMGLCAVLVVALFVSMALWAVSSSLMALSARGA